MVKAWAGIASITARGLSVLAAGKAQAKVEGGTVRSAIAPSRVKRNSVPPRHSRRARAGNQDQRRQQPCPQVLGLIWRSVSHSPALRPCRSAQLNVFIGPAAYDR